MIETKWYRNKETGLEFEFEADSAREKTAKTNPDLVPIDGPTTHDDEMGDAKHDGADGDHNDAGGGQPPVETQGAPQV